MSETKPKVARTKSATARLQTPPELLKKFQEQVVKERRKRVSSARQNREKQESSKKVFPKTVTGDQRDRYRTVYTNDFEGTYLPPTEGRPTSPTRRNNPHPAKVKFSVLQAAFVIILPWLTTVSTLPPLHLLAIHGVEGADTRDWSTTGRGDDERCSYGLPKGLLSGRWFRYGVQIITIVSKTLWNEHESMLEQNLMK